MSTFAQKTKMVKTASKINSNTKQIGILTKHRNFDEQSQFFWQKVCCRPVFFQKK